MNLPNIEHDLSLTALVVGTVKISLTSTSDTNSLWNIFNDEIIVIEVLLIQLAFHQQYGSKFSVESLIQIYADQC